MILLRELEEELRQMKPHSPIYKLVKAELQRRGHWKNKPRGKSFTKSDGKIKPTS
jgi:hypothetical protein